VPIQDLHVSARIRQRGEARLLVEPVGVLRREDPTPQALEPRMRADDLHQPDGEAEAAVGGQDEDVGDVRERREIRDDPREADLRVGFVEPERKRVPDRRVHDLARDAARPVRLAEVAVNDGVVQPARIRGDHVRVPAPLLPRVRSVRFHGAHAIAGASYSAYASGQRAPIQSTIALPLWLTLLLALLAAWAAVDRLLIPSVRWILRRRVNRVLEELNTRLKIRI